MKKFSVVILVCLLIFAVSCDVSNRALSELIRKSQPRDDIRWMDISIVPSTTDSSKVDYAVLLSQRGVHTFYSKSGEIVGDLKTPSIKSDKDTNGIFSNGRVYIPINYDTTSFHKVILRSSSVEPKENGMFFLFDPIIENGKEAELKEVFLDVSSITGYDSDYGFKESSSFDSKRVMYRTLQNGEYTYHIARFRADDANSSFTFEDEKTFKTSDSTFETDKEFTINRIWESPSLKNAVVMYNEKEEQDYNNVCKYAIVDLEAGSVSELNALNMNGSSKRNLLFEHFVVYDEKSDSKPIWMGILRSGVLYHSHSNKDDLTTSDSAFSFDRYAPLSSFFLSNDDKGSGAIYGCMLFGKYTSTGFIATRFRKMPNSDNKLIADYNESGTDYRNSYTITNRFAENLRAEEISTFGYFNATTSPGFLHSVVVLTVKTGISTYKFTDAVPYNFTTGGEEARDKVDLPFNDFT